MSGFTGIAGGGGLKKHHQYFFFGYGFVWGSFGYNDAFVFAQCHCFVAEFDGQVAADHHKHFVFIVVLVPYKLAFEAGQFDVLAVEFTHDFGRPVFGEAVEFFLEIDLVHGQKMELEFLLEEMLQKYK